jgi:hypothetical protein
MNPQGTERFTACSPPRSSAGPASPVAEPGVQGSGPPDIPRCRPGHRAVAQFVSPSGRARSPVRSPPTVHVRCWAMDISRPSWLRPEAIRFVLSDRIRRRREVTEVGIAVAAGENSWWPARRADRRAERGHES